MVRQSAAEGGKPATGYALRRFPALRKKRTIHLLQNRTFLFTSDRAVAIAAFEKEKHMSGFDLVIPEAPIPESEANMAARAVVRDALTIVFLITARPMPIICSRP